MPGAYFVTTSRGLEPTEQAQGPWSPTMLHGRLLGGLAARAIEASCGAPDFVAARLTVDLFKAAPLAPVQVSTTVVRDGRRIRVADAALEVGGAHVARASAVLLRRSDEPPGRVWRPEPWRAPHPDDLPTPDEQPPEEAWLVKIVDGGFDSAERAGVWTCETAPLVDEEVLSPFVRAAVSADLASPLVNAGDDGLHYINADYSLTMAREPAGEWVGLEAAQHVAGAGLSVAACTLYDLDGPFGMSVATALANPPLRPGS